MKSDLTIVLQGEEARKWAMMKALDAVGFFDIVYGRATVDFDGQGKVSNVKIERNFRIIEVKELSTLDTK